MQHGESLVSVNLLMSVACTDLPKFAESFHCHGYGIVEHVLTPHQIEGLRESITALPSSSAVRRRSRVYGVRNLLELSSDVCALASSPALWRIATAVLGERTFATRAVFFDKNPDANWALGWHQDSVISVTEKIDTPGFLAWGQKAGVWQVQPPAAELAKMVALRVHLDDCGEENGALRVIPGSHCHGWLDNHISEWRERVPEVCCPVESGDVVAMCPTVLHASSRASVPTHRRVIHIEYAAHELPGMLEWNRRVTPATLSGVPASS